MGQINLKTIQRMGNMKAINIYTYSRIQEDIATEFENILSKKSKKLKVKPQEFYAIRSLVNMLLGIGVEIKDFENFFFHLR